MQLNSLTSRLAAGATMLLAMAGIASADPGAIYTSTYSGGTVNQNLYENKEDVYLNGGPQGMNPHGLPDGEYYFQVTDPSGAVLLSTDAAKYRILKVVDGVVSGASDTGNHASGAFNPANGSTAVQLIPFNTTPNGGGEYKVWLIHREAATVVGGVDGVELDFDHNDAKTDNFKIRSDIVNPPQNTYTISGRKFYDANFNGIDDGEPGITGVTIHIDYTYPDNTTGSEEVTTGVTGYWTSSAVPDGTFFHAYEVVGGNWIQTCPAAVCSDDNRHCYEGQLQGADAINRDFGNIASANITGTKFYDHNMNGQADSGDQGLAGFTIDATITLPNGSIVNDSTTTGAGGSYSFGPYPAGSTFTLVETLPTGAKWINTVSPPAGALGTPGAGDFDGSGDLSATFTLGNANGGAFGNIAFGPVSGFKFYDTNVNGVMDSGEVGIGGVTINITETWPDGSVHTASTVTAADGSYKFTGLPDGSTFTVDEVVPAGYYRTSGAISGTIGGGSATDITFTIESTGNNFGNVQLGGGTSALTLGFWSNKNGQARMMDGNSCKPELNILIADCVRNANGTLQTFGLPTATEANAFKNFSNWILAATATNMANMLSAQLAAMELNVEWNPALGNAVVYAPGTPSANPFGFTTINALMADARAKLCVPGNLVVLDGNPLRACMERIKTALDKANNNLNFVVGP